MKRSVAIAVIAAVCSGLACGQDEESGFSEVQSGPASTEIRARYLAAGVPVQPDDEVWESAPELAVGLMAQLILPPQGGGSVDEVKVRALHDGEQLAFRFEWEDATENREVGGDTFRDAIAVGFPTRLTETLPSPLMGDAEHPVNIWQWTADFDANAQGQGGFSSRYPHTEGVWYFPQDYAVTREVRAWRGTEPVIELEAKGFGTLERKVSQNVLGLGVHEDGRWRVVLRRRLSTGNPGDTLFRPGDKTQVILAVWDGGSGEVNGRKGVTMTWTPLQLSWTFGAGD
ncbi:MAG: ethylbenzene dehydrogenase-related protein [Myxococcota bacterium]